MIITETINQQIKALPAAKALNILQFVELLESKPDSPTEIDRPLSGD